MRRLLFSTALVALIAACTPPTQQEAEAPSDPAPQVQACNTITPDNTRMIRVEDATAVASAASTLPGGPITPGVYDLTRAVRVDQPTGWQNGRAVALEVTETADGVVFQWAGAPASGEVDRWTASYTDTPTSRISYTCGRMGDVPAEVTARASALQLRLTDGANGSLLLDFTRRS